MSGKSKPKGAAMVAGTARGANLSSGYAKPVGSVSTPESKMKSTPDHKSTSSQSQTPVKVPHYLRASTGSCHDFCKYGGRRVFEEEERKGGSYLSKKKSALKKGPEWKDIVSYDVTPKTAKPKALVLDSKKVVEPTKPKLERPTGLARQNLHRRSSLETSCFGAKPMLTPVKVSSAPAKTKTVGPGLTRKESSTISNRPKIHGSSQPKVKRGSTGIVSSCAESNVILIDIARNCSETGMGPTSTLDGNGHEGSVERTLYVVEPELNSVAVQVDHPYKEKTVEEFKSDMKETTDIDFSFEENVMAKIPMNCLLNDTDKSIRDSSTPVSPDEGIVVESEIELGEKTKKSEPDYATIVVSENGGNKNSEPEDEVIRNSGSISSESGEKFEPDLESDLESSAEEEQSMESESESESEKGSLSISRSNSSCSVGSASKNEKQKGEHGSRRRSSSNQLEEKKPYKLKFKPVRVIELKPDGDSGPRRLKFRKPRVVGESTRSGGDGKKVSYRKRNGADHMGSNCVDEKSAGVVLRHQDGERKDGQTSLFNNVIEETASKLVESRKSKVKALVGAFETVISLQDGKPTSSA